MNAKREALPWVDKIQLVLFAPAHMGANILELAATGFGFLTWMGPAKAAAIALFPPLQDLQKGSSFLSRLHETAEEIGVHGTTKAAVVVHASDDRVVFQDPFYRDPPSVPYHDSNHVHCCKPKRFSFGLPLDDVAKALP